MNFIKGAISINQKRISPICSKRIRVLVYEKRCWYSRQHRSSLRKLWTFSLFHGLAKTLTCSGNNRLSKIVVFKKHGYVSSVRVRVHPSSRNRVFAHCVRLDIVSSGNVAINGSICHQRTQYIWVLEQSYNTHVHASDTAAYHKPTTHTAYLLSWNVPMCALFSTSPLEASVHMHISSKSGQCSQHERWRQN